MKRLLLRSKRTPNHPIGLGVLILCLMLCGCAGITQKRRQLEQLQEAIKQKDAEINTLKNAIKERDAKIQEMKNKLSSFGAF
jgi:hypothetical protein